MLKNVRQLSLKEAAPRLLADLVVIYASMVGALALSVLYQSMVGGPDGAYKLTAQFREFYLREFAMLALVFPVIFTLNGFYTHSRAYSDQDKIWAVLRGVTFGMMGFLSLSLLLFHDAPIGRSVAIPFALLAAIGTSGTRLFKAFIERHHEASVGLIETAGGGAVEIGKDADKRILILGGAGYIGSTLVRELIGQGRKLRILDKLVYGAAALSELLEHPDIELVVGDCRNITDVIAAMRGVTSIVDLAAIVGDPACEQDRQTALEVNYAATRMILEVAKGQGVGRFVFASSCSVYGSSSYEVDEQAELQPLSLYAQTKVESEKAVLQAHSESFHPTVLRFATVFGLGYRPRFDLVVNLLTARACQEGTITIYNGQQWRPFIHVKDVARAIIQVLDAPLSLVSGEIFNVGDRRMNHTLAEVGELIQRVCPTTRIEHVDNTDRRDYRVSFGKIRQWIGFQCQVTLLDGIQECKSSLEEKRIVDYRDPWYHNELAIQSGNSAVDRNDFNSQVMAAFAGPLPAGPASLEPQSTRGRSIEILSRNLRTAGAAAE
jgi:nucleoside-diphosphate-sugar epimerase